MTGMTRQIGSNPGIQLNPLVDNSAIPLNDAGDQVFATIGRFVRGRYDKPFLVNAGNVNKKLGGARRLSVLALNMARIHVHEALKNGASSAVIQRLVRPTTIAHKWIYATNFTSINLTPVIGNGAIASVGMIDKGKGYTQKPTVTISDGSNAGIAVKISESGAILGIRVWGGSNYKVPNKNGVGGSTITITGSGGTGATARLKWPKNKAPGSLSSLDGVIVEMLTSGTGYPRPTITVAEDATNTAAIATATLSGLTSSPTSLDGATVAVTNAGQWYDNNVDIQISGGTGGTITPTVVDGEIVNIAVSGGTGYTNASVITITRGVGFIVEMRPGTGAIESIFPPKKSGANFKVGTSLTITGTNTTPASAKITDTDDGFIISAKFNQAVGESLDDATNLPISFKVTSGSVDKKAAGYVTVANGLITDVVITARGSGYVASKLKVTVNQAGNPEVFASLTPPDQYDGDYMFAFKHLEAFNDGIIVDLHANEKRVNGFKVANNEITLRIKDPKTKEVLYQFTGVLDEDATDDYGNSTYLPDIVAKQTDCFEFVVGHGTSVAPASSAYGYDDNGREQWSSTVDPIRYFSEGASDLTAYDYNATDLFEARKKLQGTNYYYNYIASCGSEDTGLLSELAALAYETNTQFRFDVPYVYSGTDTVARAITFVTDLNFGANEAAHLIHAYWTPLTCDDPTGVNGRISMGTATLNIAQSCRRNASKNSKGLPPKNYPVAGANFPINRSNIRQEYFPNDQELSALADAKINVAIFKQFSSGGRYVYTDFLTQAPVTNSLRKLISVAEMSTHIDREVIGFGNEAIALPMQDAIREMGDFLKELFEGAEMSGWLVPSSELGGKSFAYVAKANEQRPYDWLDVAYSLSYDGAVRVINVTQTLVRR